MLKAGVQLAEVVEEDKSGKASDHNSIKRVEPGEPCETTVNDGLLEEHLKA